MSNAHARSGQGLAKVANDIPAKGSSEELPLCVDLEGTLIRANLLSERFASAIRRPGILALLRALLTFDRTTLGERMTRAAPIDVSLLPYNEPFVAFLREQHRNGRKLVLATDADAAVAHAIAEHLGLFEEVIASGGKTGLEGRTKAAALVERFGRKGFVYAGNDGSDAPCWEAARAIMIVNASPSVREQARAIGRVEGEFAGRTPMWRAALRAMRPHQWVKNLLVFVPMITSQTLGDTSVRDEGIAILLSFCATASAIYIFNDLTDIEADRQHPLKRFRPLASGALSLSTAIVLAAGLLAAGLSLAFWTDTVVFVAAYIVVSLAYSLVLKERALVDVFVLAALYSLRVLAGGVATGYHVSFWLLGFSGFLFLSLALVKRVEELLAVAKSGKQHTAVRRGYTTDDLPMLQMFGCASAFASTVVLALFVASDKAFAHYASPEFLWGIVPLILFWQCRLWLSTIRGHMHSDPIIYAARDWVSWAVAICVLALVFIAASGVISLGFGEP